MLALFAEMGRPDAAGEWRGELRLGAIASVQTGLLPEALPRFRQLAPHVELKLVPGVSLDLLSRLDAGELDLALLIKPPFALPKEILEVPLAHEPFVLIVPTYGGGTPKTAVPKQVIAFLNNPDNRALCRGVIASGNTNFGQAYCLAGDIIASKLGVPFLYRYELLGTPTDVARVKEGLEDFWQTR